jgi:hypothetical protein
MQKNKEIYGEKSELIAEVTENFARTKLFGRD